MEHCLYMLTLQSLKSRIVYLLVFKVKKDSLGYDIFFLGGHAPIKFDNKFISNKKLIREQLTCLICFSCLIKGTNTIFTNHVSDGDVQWGLKSWIFKFQTYLYLDLGWFGIKMIGTITTPIAIVTSIWKWNQYIEIQDGSYLVRFGMVGMSGVGMPFKSRAIQHPNNFPQFKIQMCSIFEPPMQYLFGLKLQSP